MTIKTKASHQLWLFKAKNCDLNVKVDVSAPFSNTPAPGGATQHWEVQLIPFFFL